MRRYVPRSPGRWVTCQCGKRSYPTRKAAKRARLALVQAGLETARTETARIGEYPCGTGWHFGHQVATRANRNDPRLKFLPGTA